MNTDMSLFSKSNIDWKYDSDSDSDSYSDSRSNSSSYSDSSSSSSYSDSDSSSSSSSSSSLECKNTKSNSNILDKNIDIDWGIFFDFDKDVKTIEELKNKILVLNNEIEEYKRDIKFVELSNKKLEEENMCLRNEKLLVKKANNNLRRRLEIIESNVDNLSDSNDRLHNENVKLSIEVVNSNYLVLNLREEVDRKEKVISRKDGKVGRLLNIIREKNKEIKKVKSKVKTEKINDNISKMIQEYLDIVYFMYKSLNLGSKYLDEYMYIMDDLENNYLKSIPGWLNNLDNSNNSRSILINNLVNYLKCEHKMLDKKIYFDNWLNPYNFEKLLEDSKEDYFFKKLL